MVTKGGTFTIGDKVFAAPEALEIPDINHIGEVLLYPIETRFVSGDFRAHLKYILDEKGYRWVGC